MNIVGPEESQIYGHLGTHGSITPYVKNSDVPADTEQCHRLVKYCYLIKLFKISSDSLI